MSKVALSMIVKGSEDEPKMLNVALESIAKFVDGIFITYTGTKEDKSRFLEVCKKYKVNVSYAPDNIWYKVDKKLVDWFTKQYGYAPHAKVGDRIFRFDTARNYALSQIDQKEYPWFIWLDVDDIFRNGEKIKEIIEDAEKKQIDAVYLNYLYQVEIEGDRIKNIIIEHLRERILRNNGIYKWIAPIHETLIEQKPSRKKDYHQCDVVHLADIERRTNAIMRNLSNLELSIFETKAEDPRPVYYLAKAYFDLNKPEYDDKAMPLINEYLLGEHKSGWPEERSQAWEYLAEIYRRRKQHNNSIKACMNALIECPEFQSIYVNLAISYMPKEQWDRALFYVKLGTSFPSQKTTLINNPKDIQMRILQVIYECSIHLNKIDEAWAAANKLKEIAKGDPAIEQIYHSISELRTQRDLVKVYVEMYQYLAKSGQASKIKALLGSAPEIIKNTPFYQDMYKKNMPPKMWEKEEIALYCGPGFTNWSPKRLDNPQESFVGGSEEAVIRLSQELSKLGWRVTVYADPGEEEGEYDGVRWLPYFKFNHLDHFNILVIWRVPQHLDVEFKAKQIYVWCHDIQNNLEWNDERVKKLTKAIFLSKWHRDNVPALPDDKVIISSNAI